MNTYQLDCGHWQSEPATCGIGSILGCVKCNTLRSVVIGMATAPEFAATRTGGEAAL